MNTVPIKLKFLNPGARAPEYKTDGAAGADLYFAPADGQPKTLAPGERAILSVGFVMEIPPGYEVQVRPRSGLALSSGVTVVNSPGTVDSDYRGEMGALLINHGTEPVEFKPGDRIAQMVLSEVPTAVFVVVDQLSETGRGAGGYGSTGRADVRLCGAWRGEAPEERCQNPLPCADHDGKCRSPNGRIDGHFTYVDRRESDGELVCAFCKKAARE